MLQFHRFQSYLLYLLCVLDMCLNEHQRSPPPGLSMQSVWMQSSLHCLEWGDLELGQGSNLYSFSPVPVLGKCFATVCNISSRSQLWLPCNFKEWRMHTSSPMHAIWSMKKGGRMALIFTSWEKMSLREVEMKFTQLSALSSTLPCSLLSVINGYQDRKES